MLFLMFLLAVALAAACGESRSPEPVVITDSAGIQIVSYSAPLFELGTQWSIDSISNVTIGVAEGVAEYELDDVVTAVRLPTGSIVIADRGRNELLAFAGDGQFLRTVGGPGDGPGEFGSIGWLQVVHPDTLLVYDPDLRRASAFTLEEGFAWSVPVQSAGYAWPGKFRTSDGTFVLALVGNEVWDGIRTGSVLPGTTVRNQLHFTTFSRDGLLIDTIGSFAGYEEAVTERDGQVATMYAPWGRNASYSLMPDNRIVVGTQDAGELAVLDRHGERETVVRWPAGDLTVTEEHVDRFHDVMFQRVEDPGERQAAIDELGELPLPDKRAAYGELMTDASGLVWVAEAHLPLTAAREWRVIDLDSGNVGRVVLPPGFDLLWAGEEEVIGRTTDELGVQRIEVRALRRAGSELSRIPLPAPYTPG